MKEKWTHNLLGKFAAGLFTIAMILFGVCFFNTESSSVQAEETATESTAKTTSTEAIYVPVENITSYRSGDTYTYPKPTESGKEDWIFAGWYYEDAEAENGYAAYGSANEMNNVTSAHAKYVSPDVLSAKFQVTAGTNAASEKASLRIVSTVDSTDYRKVGFQLTSLRTGKTQTTTSTTVYKRIKSATEGLEYGYSPVIFDTEAEYFTTVTIANIKNAYFDYGYIATPYWITMDGTTVYGVARSAKVSDSYNSIANIPVRLYTDATVGAGTITVTYDATAFTYKEFEKYAYADNKGTLESEVTVADGGTTDGVGTVTITLPEGTSFVKPDGMLVNLRFNILAEASSNETFEMTSGDFEGTCDSYYRTFSSYYTGTPDTSWYDEFSDGDTFVIATADDLYGFEQLVNATKGKFAGQTIYLGADITVNKGLATATGWDATKDEDSNTITDGTSYLWKPMGDNWDYRFQGCFDGNGHVIKGIYLNNQNVTTSARYQGLFGSTHANSTVRNFELRNSYFECVDGYWKSTNSTTGVVTTYALLGSVIGQMGGNIDTVYSNAIVKSAHKAVGGIVGRTNTGSNSSTGVANTGTITNCWFDGSVTVNEAEYTKAVYVGGVLGTRTASNLVIQDCLNTGTITYTYDTVDTEAVTAYSLYIGGVIGSLNAGSSESSCVGAGTTSIQDSWSDSIEKTNYNTVCNGGTKSKNVGMSASTWSNYNGYLGYTATKSNLTFYEWETDSGNWVCRATDSTNALDGIPTLKSFCDEWIDVSWYYDDTDATEYTISHAEELYGWSELDNIASVILDDGVVVKLGDDIKLNSGTASVWATTTNADILNSVRTFSPLGGNSNSTAFGATFDGQGYEISGLYINSTTSHTGLFGYTTGTVKDFSLINSYVTSTATSTGGIVAYAEGATVENIYSDAFVHTTAAQNNTGGIVGYAIKAGMTTNITGCWFDGEVKQFASAQYAGGILGRQGAGTVIITDCLFTGKVTTNRATANAYAGGIVGGVYSTATGDANAVSLYITNTVSNGEVFAINTKTTAAVGSVLGSANSGSANTVVMTVNMENVYDSTVVTSESTLSMVVDGVGTPSNRMMNGIPMTYTDGYLNGDAGYVYTKLTFRGSNEDASGNGAWVATANGPELYNFSDTKTISTFADVARAETDWYYNEFDYVNKVLQDREYIICDANDFRGMAPLVNNAIDNFSGKTVSVDENTEIIDLSEGWTVSVDETGNVTTNGTPMDWVPIGTASSASRFYGIFDGNGCTIRGAYVDYTGTEKNMTGLFGYGGFTGNYIAEIKNFTLENSYFKMIKQAGAVVGGLQGTVRNVYVKDNVVVESTQNNIGGIAGHVLSTKAGTGIYNCWFDGTIISNSGTYVGGIAGCVAGGTVANPKTIENCLFTGNVISEKTGNAYVGGILGGIYSTSDTAPSTASITNCLVAGAVKVATSEAAVGAVLGYADNRATAAVSTAKLTNVYYTAEPVNYSTGETISITGTTPGCGLKNADLDNGTLQGVAQLLTVEELTGTDAYKYTELNLASKTENTEGTWVLKSTGVPELNTFSDSDVDSIEDVQTLTKGWYYNAFTFDSSAKQATTTFTVHDDGDMFGLADLVNNDAVTFSGMTVNMNNDIVFNNVSTGEEAETWANNPETRPTNSWVPIGTSSHPFEGTFDGKENTISGLFMSRSVQGSGLFGEVVNPTIQNLRLTNSYMEFTSTNADASACLGSIIGYGDGILTNIYSDAILVSSGVNVGGFVGYVNRRGDTDNANLNITNCWYDGKATLNALNTDNQMSFGGFIGRAYYGANTIDTCLYTGDMICNYMPASARTGMNAGMGGLVGMDRSSGYVIVSDSIASGTMEFNWKVNPDYPVTNKPNVNDVCDIFGMVYNASSAANDSVIAATDVVKSFDYGEGSSTEVTLAYKIGNGGNAENFDINTSWANTNILNENKVKYNEQYLRGLGTYFLTDMPFATTEGATEGWAVRHSALPIPVTLTDVVDDAIEPTKLIVPDVAWYGDGSASSYEIDTVAELYGLAKLSQTNTFANQTITLTADININSGEDDGTAAEWAAGTKIPTLCWYPIGRDAAAARFAGTFKGAGHKITGIYMNQEILYMGLFAMTSYGSSVENLAVQNSYIYQRGENAAASGFTGAVVSDLRGDMSNVYSDAYVRTEKGQTGGLVARANGFYNDETGAKITTEVNINNCWYSGQIVGGENSRYIGGLVGTVVWGTLNMTNVESTGSIDFNYTGTSENGYVGGLVGYTQGNPTNLSITSAIAATDIFIERSYDRVGAVVGYLSNGVSNSGTVNAFAHNPQITFSNVFASRDCFNVSYVKEGTETGTLVITEAVKDDESTPEIDETAAAVTQEITSTITITGTVLQTSGADRLMGYGTQESGHTLNFAGTWTLRTNDVPVLTCFADLATNTISNLSAATLAKEIGLDYWNASAAITDAKASGGGNYLVTYTTTDSLTYAGYIEKLVNELGFQCYADNSASDMDTDGIVSSTYYKEATATTGEWVLNITYTAADSTIYISINTDLDSRDDNLVSATQSGSAPISLSMMELTNSSRYGNGFVFQLPDGHFIVNDGGMAVDATTLIDYLKELAGKTNDVQNPVYIDAWILTHYHSDHAGALHSLYSTPELREGIYLKAVYASEPSTYALTSWDESHIGTVGNALRGAMTLTKSDTDSSKPDVYQMHMGQRYYFNGITMDVIDTQEQHHTSTWGDYKDPDKFNATSTNCLYTFADATGVTKKVLIGGDATNVNMRYIMDVYGKNYTTYNHDTEAYGGTSKTLSDVNIFVTYHHGKNTTCTYGSSTVDVGLIPYDIKGVATYEWADYLLKNTNNTMVKFDAVLFPYHQVFDTVAKATWTAADGTVRYTLYVGDDQSIAFPYNMTEINQYFKDNAKAYYTYGYEDAFAATNEESHGTVKIVFDGNNAATAAERKANVDGTTGETQ